MKIGIALYPRLPGQVRAILAHYGAPIADGEYRKLRLPDHVIHEIQELMAEATCAREVDYARLTGSDEPSLKSSRIWAKQHAQADDDSKALYRKHKRDEDAKERPKPKPRLALHKKKLPPREEKPQPTLFEER